MFLDLVVFKWSRKQKGKTKPKKNKILHWIDWRHISGRGLASSKLSSSFMSERGQPKMYFRLNRKKKVDSQVAKMNWTPEFGQDDALESHLFRYQHSFLKFALFDKFNQKRWNVHYSSHLKMEWKSRTGLGARSH